MRIATWANFVWLFIYVVVIAGSVTAMFYLRSWSLREFDTPQSQQEWEIWRDETARQAEGSGPVLRRKAKSEQPPTLVLMRDHFGMLVGTIIAFGSALFFTLMVMLRGAFAPSPMSTTEK